MRATVSFENGDPGRDAVVEALSRTDSYIVRERYRGYDPYDALLSPLFKLPVLRSNKLVRLAAQQTLRRLPVNVRPLLRIPKGYNPVTLGLAVQAHAYLSVADPPRADYHRAQVVFCIEELKRLRSVDYSGACWGYDFPWEARHGRVPAFVPTIVATGIITNGLFTAFELLGSEEALSLCASACDFVLHDLERVTEPNGTFCWGYFPSDRHQVINATLKGARLCAQVYSQTGRADLREAAALTARYAVDHQRGDGAWPYAVGDPRSWVDNFHTGYVLDCLAEYSRRTGDGAFAAAIEQGWRYYRRSFFEEDCIPRYYDTRTRPIDITACAQSLLTLASFDDRATRDRVAGWVIDNMQKRDGSFVYRIHRGYTNRIAYMRWGCAWMFAALSRVVYDLARDADGSRAEPS